MVTNFKKSFLLLITAIFFTQSLILGCSTEVDSEVKKMEEEEQDVITVVKKTHSVQGIPESWATTDVYAYAYDDNGNKILIPVTVQNGVATFKADETYTKCVLVSLPKGTGVSAYTANPASILSADCQKSEVIDLTKDSLSFVLVKSDYIGTWNSLTDKLVINEDGTFSLDIGNNDSVDCAGTYVDTKTCVKANYSEKVDGTDVSKTLEFTKQEADVLVGTINEKETYFVKASTETPNLNGTWKNSEGTTTTIINNESKKIYVKDGETEIWGTIEQNDNSFILQDESSNVIGIGFVSAAGNAYIYNEATGTYEIFTRNGSATESDSKIPLKMFTVTYKSEHADDDVQEKAEGTVLELQTPSHKGYRFDGWYTDEGKTAKAEATYTIAENLTFYAKWVQQGTVKFTSAQSEHSDVTVDLGTEIDIPTPAKEKFDFDGWFIGETKISGKYTVTKDVELVAKWTALYNVTFETAGGSPVKSLENVRAGTKITLDEPKWDGYYFEWWAAEGKTFVKDDEYTVNSDVIFVAKWAGLCTVVYNTDGGSSVESKTVHAMETIQMPAAPTKDGYRFLGWYTTDENNLMQPDDSFKVTDSVTINAKWVAQYKYYFDNNDGNAHDVAYTIVDENTEITIELEPTRDGYVFKGWFDGEQIYQLGELYTITKDTVFTAEWVKLYTYYYFNNYEEEEIDPSTLPTAEDGSEITVGAAIERTGYIFKGWSDGEQTYQPGELYTINANVVFEAVWVKLFTYEYNDGIPADEDPNYQAPTAEAGDLITLKAAPFRDGYVFKGWSDGENTYQPSDEYTINADVVFEAVWNPLYSYVYEGYGAGELEKDATMKIADAPEVEGCSFVGWSDGIKVWQPGEDYKITGDVEFTPIWNVTVTYESEFIGSFNETCTRGSSITLPEQVFNGYTFVGWDNGTEIISGGESFVVDADITFTAVWTSDSVVYSISGVPTNDTWQSGTVVAWVWNYNVETGFVVYPTFDKGTADYSFETAEDIQYCAIFVVDSMPSEPVTKDALVENSTAKSADMDISSGNAVFEAYKEVYTITNVAINNWYKATWYNNYVKISGDEESWIEAKYDAENETLTFRTEKDFDACVVCGFAPNTRPITLDLSVYTDSQLMQRSVVLIMVDNTAEFAYDERKNLADTNIIYFRDEKSWQHNGDKKIYAHFSSTTSAETAKVEMENINYDSWFKVAVDYEKFDTVYFTGNDSSVGKKTESCVMSKDCIFYRPTNNEVSSNTFGIQACVDSVEDPDR